MKRNILVLMGIFIIACIVAISGCTDDSSSNSTASSSSSQASAEAPFTIENLKVVSQGYGGYDIKGDLTPNKDISYLEMVTIWYDSSGTVIEKSPLTWNMNDLKAGQKVKISGSTYVPDGETPAKVEVLIFDSVFSGGDDSGAIYRKTIEL